MGLFANLFDAAAAGVRAKADDEARRAAARASGKRIKDEDCTPCAANARVMAYRQAAELSGAQPSKKRRR